MNDNLHIQRYPTTIDRSLRAWSAADVLMIDHFESIASKDEVSASVVVIYNDRFGFLTAHSHTYRPHVIADYHSQQTAITKNLTRNDLAPDNISFEYPLNNSDYEVDVAMVRVPKSMDKFLLQINEIHSRCKKDATVICGFMTKYFTPKMISIAEEYFGEVTQSRAVKKARLLILKSPKSVSKSIPLRTILYKNSQGNSTEIKQYNGVFSAKQIDYATQLLIDKLTIGYNEKVVLDLACGNGIIGYEVLLKSPDVELHTLDDSWLALESAKLNVNKGRVTHHFAHHLDDIGDDFFDLVVCNPPFHFEHENTIDIALDLFRGVQRTLKPDGRFICVANNHLNYATHLEQLFGRVSIMAENDRFSVFKCSQIGTL